MIFYEAFFMYVHFTVQIPTFCCRYLYIINKLYIMYIVMRSSSTLFYGHFSQIFFEFHFEWTILIKVNTILFIKKISVFNF